MPKRKTFRKRHRKMNQKGGAVSNHWLKVTRRNQNDIAVEIIDSNAKNDLCSTISSSSSSSSASGGGPSNLTLYTSFDNFVNDNAVDEKNILLLQLTNEPSNFDNQFDIASLMTITEDNINWTNPVSC
jgi:hypothetical protein